MTFRGSGAIWLTLQAGEAGDPSLRLKSGYAQDDSVIQKCELHHYPFRSRLLIHRLRLLLAFLTISSLPASLFAPAFAQTTSGKPLTQMSEPARTLVAINVSGLKRYHKEDVVAATGLVLGSVASEDEFKKAARRLGDTGAFADIVYSYTYSSAGTKLELKVVEIEKFAPVHFVDFVWFAEEEIRRAIKEHVPLFDGELPISGRMPDQVSDVLQGMLVQLGVPGHVNYERVVRSTGGIESFTYAVSDVLIRIRKIEFTGVGPIELPALQNAAERMTEREYSRTRLVSFVEHDLMPIFRSSGYLKAAFGPPTPKVVKAAENKTAVENVEGPRNQTFVDVSFAVDPGSQYKLSKLEWEGNHDVPTEMLQPFVHAAIGKPANTVKLTDELVHVRDLYGTRGYVAATLKAEAHFDDAARTVALVIHVKEDAVYHMGELEFRGLDNGLTAKLRAAWKLRPGDVFNSDYLKEYLPEAEKLLPASFDWKVDPHVTANVRDKSVDVDLQYSVSAPK